MLKDAQELVHPVGIVVGHQYHLLQRKEAAGVLPRPRLAKDVKAASRFTLIRYSPTQLVCSFDCSTIYSEPLGLGWDYDAVACQSLRGILAEKSLRLPLGLRLGRDWIAKGKMWPTGPMLFRQQDD